MSLSKNDRRFEYALRAASIFAGSLLLLIILFLIGESLPALKSVGWRRFLTDSRWSPAGELNTAQFRLLPMMIASLLVTTGAIMLSAPIGLGAALFAVFYAPTGLRGLFVSIVELLGGIPSVVYGLWGLVVLVPIISSWQPPGASLLAGILILSMMIIPTITLLSIAALEQVPTALIQSSASLGFTAAGTLQKVVLPSVRSGITTAMLLAIARAIGETMAVLMVCGNVIRMPESVFDPVRTLTANIALEMAYALDLHRSALFVTGLALIAIVMILVLASERVRGRSRYV